MDTQEQSQPQRAATPKLTGRKKRLFILFYGLILLFLLLAGAELIARLKGFKPYRTYDMLIEVEPGGKFFTHHEDLGFALMPGRFTVRLHDGYTFHATHLPGGLRITRPLETYDARADREEIWIFGCSRTYGWSLNDDETYPWLIQTLLADYNVVNFGVNGYGTIHALLQYRDALEKRPPPLIAVLAYAGFHDNRNAFLRTRRKNVAPYNKLGPVGQPYARLDDSGRLRYDYADLAYEPFPLMGYSALIHFLEIKFNAWEDTYYRSHDVSRALILDMADSSHAHGVDFILAGIEQSAPTREMLAYAGRQGIRSVDMSVNLNLRGHRNLPHDTHPSAIANRLYARKLGSYLMNRLF
jgi:hypothetical protein